MSFDERIPRQASNGADLVSKRMWIDKNKIRIKPSSDGTNNRRPNQSATSLKPTIREDEELEEQLSNKVNLADKAPISSDNLRAPKSDQLNNHNNKENSASLLQADKLAPNGGSSGVFKSANWLSESELIFSLSNQVGGLVRALRIFEELDIGIKHVESRKSKRRESEFEIFVDIDCNDQDKMKKLVHHLRLVS